MKTLKFSLLAIAVGSLVACGGGGNGAGKTTTPDGDKLNLSLGPKGKVSGKTANGTLLGQNNPNSFYGVWLDDSEQRKELWYQGTAATNIPQSGKATYYGDAVWISGYDSTHKTGGKTALNVDFDNKTVDGTIKFSVVNGDEFRRDITLHQGHLSGHQFSGKASVLGNDSGAYRGALFGEGATEAAGLVEFKNNSNLDVSFGGRRY